jgi:serine-type D-Ala-D-Ala carboxypeptidase
MKNDREVDGLPHAHPASTISAFLSERIRSGDFPSSVYLIAEGDETIFSDALGQSVIEPYRIAANLQTIYDLASLTKPLITAMLCARRIESGELRLDSPVSHFLPEFERMDKQAITVRHLLTHASGLPAWRPLYILAEGKPDLVVSVIAGEQLESKPGTRVVYSDLGFIVLGLLLEHVSGNSVSQLAQNEIFAPLQLKQTFSNPDIALQTGIAACETGNVYEQQTNREAGMGEYDGARKGLIWGEVHDGNAYFLGGAAGHAGLFSTASETRVIAQQFLPNLSRLLKPETCKLARENLTEGLNEARSAGWQLAMTKDSTAGTSLPPHSFGHTGFTGTSCWVDPDHHRVFILLTNRTHTRLPPFVNINSTRREFHRLAVKALENRRRAK